MLPGLESLGVHMLDYYTDHVPAGIQDNEKWSARINDVNNQVCTILSALLLKKLGNAKGGNMVMAGLPDDFWKNNVVNIDTNHYPKADANGFIKPDDDHPAAAAAVTLAYNHSILCIKQTVKDYQSLTARLLRKLIKGKQLSDSSVYVDCMSLFPTSI